MSAKTQLNGLRHQHGLAAVELAIVAPILLLLLLVVAEAGRAFFQYNTLSKAVRDSARYYSTEVFAGNNIAGAKNLVRFGQIGVGTPLLPGAYTIPDPVTVINVTGTYVTVTGSYTFTCFPGNPLSRIMGLFGPGLGLPNTLTLNATSTMRAI
jgi:Flp pilus assembly protein TadG